MLNSIWFSVIVHAVEVLKKSSDIYGEYVWANVITAKINNLGVDLDSQDSYKIVTTLLNDPLLRLGDIF